MKSQEEPPVNSRRGNPREPNDLYRSVGDGSRTTGSLSLPGPTVAAHTGQPALGDISESLMERVVESANMDTVWKNVKANRGAAGPDGITIAEFPDWIRPRWSTFRQQLLDGTCRPQPVRRVTIEKPDGSGQRLSGIPNIVDRLIQQAIVQVLPPIIDPGFPKSSFGFRPKRSGHGAAKQIQRIIRRGYHYAADLDLSKFFDRVQHDVLMSRVARKVKDDCMLHGNLLEFCPGGIFGNHRLERGGGLVNDELRLLQPIARKMPL